MALRIFDKEYRYDWEFVDQYSYSTVRKLDRVKDRRLLEFIAIHGTGLAKMSALRTLRIKEEPERLVSPSNSDDEFYERYMVLSEQVGREPDVEVLKDAAYNGPDEIAKFAFCRLTGYSYPSPWNDAYSYLTFACGRNRYMDDDKVREFCREMVEKEGPFAEEAAECLVKLPSAHVDNSDQESGITERDNDDSPYARLRNLLCTHDDADFSDKIRQVFDVCVLEVYEKRIHTRGLGWVGGLALDEPRKVIRWSTNRIGITTNDFVFALRKLFYEADLDISDVSDEAVQEAALSGWKEEPMHAFYLGLACLYGICGVDKDADRGLSLLKASADAGFVPAYSMLALLCEKGDCIQQDKEKSIKWLDAMAALCKSEFERAPEKRDAYISAKSDLYEKCKDYADDLIDGDPLKAEEYYDKAIVNIVEYRELLDPQQDDDFYDVFNAVALKDLSQCLNGLGWIAEDKGDIVLAEEYLARSAKIDEDRLELETHEDRKSKLREEVAVSYEYIGDMLRDAGENDLAEKYFNKADDIKGKAGKAE